MALAKWEDRGYYALRVSNEKAQRQLHRLTRKATQLLREPASGALAAAARDMGFADLQRAEEQEAAAAQPEPGSTPGKKRVGKAAAAAAAAAASAAAEAEQALAEPEVAAAVLAVASSSALQQLGTLPGWASPAGGEQPPDAALVLVADSKYAAQLPRLTRRFADVVAAAVAGDAAAAGAAATDELAGEAASRALALRTDVAKGAKARKKKALTGAGQG